MRIFIEFDMDAMEYILMCDCGRMSPTPAGPRIFRAQPHPEVQFRHATPDSAEADAVKLRAYLAGLTKKKTKKSREGA